MTTIIVTMLFYRILKRQKDAQQFLYALALFGLCLVGLGISIWLNVIPSRVTIWEAAAPYRSQIMMIGASLMVAVILAYAAWSYWVFRGKVSDEGYHLWKLIERRCGDAWLGWLLSGRASSLRLAYWGGLYAYRLHPNNRPNNHP